MKPAYFLRGDGKWAEVPLSNLVFSLPPYPTFSQRDSDLVPKDKAQKQKREVIVQPFEDPTIESFVRIVFVAMFGFCLQPYNATLWLLFWIISCPIMLSLIRGAPLKGTDVKAMYIAGIKQVPVVGRIFASRK
jgi:hypothetical protein